jgi:hypothetical protein
MRVSVRQPVLENSLVVGLQFSDGPVARFFLLEGQGFWFNIVVNQNQSDNIVSRRDSAGDFDTE